MTMHAETITEVTMSQLRMTDSVAPSADRMAALQKVSPNNAGRNINPPTLWPYLCWNGSNIVM